MTSNEQLSVSPRFCGPDGMGNGGYVAGLVAEAVGGTAKVRLHAPTPLDTPLDLVREDGSASLRHGDTVLVWGESLGKPLDLDPPPPPTPQAIAEAAPFFPLATEHMAPHCFVCGNARDPADALCLHSGNHPATGHALATWIPNADLADVDGLVAVRYIWAALDCPSYFGLQHHHRVALLAGMAARIDRRPAPGERLTVTGWAIDHDGRKHHSGSVLHDASGAPIAMARALWVDVGAVGG